MLKTFFTLLFFITLNSSFCQKDTSDQAVVRFYKQEVSLLNLNSGDTLVDIGSESGLINAMYASLVPNLFQILLDTDKDKLNKKNLRESFKSIKKEIKSDFVFLHDFKISFQDSIPLATATYNKVLCRRSLHEFAKPSKMLKEIGRILSDSGEVTVIEAIPKRKGQRDLNCNKPYLDPEQIIKMFIENNFILKNRAEEEMNIVEKGLFSVLTFAKK